MTNTNIVTYTRPSGTKIDIDISVKNNEELAKKLGWKKEAKKKKQSTK